MWSVSDPRVNVFLTTPDLLDTSSRRDCHIEVVIEAIASPCKDRIVISTCNGVMVAMLLLLSAHIE